jgi:HSP20 family protein
MRNIVITNPKSGSVFNEMDRILDSMFDNSHSFGRIGSLTTRHPAVDIKETETGYTMEVELPGLIQEDVEITIEDGVLHLSEKEKSQNPEAEDREKEQKPEDSSKRYLLRERNHRRINRSFVLPKDVDREAVQARFNNGLLILSLPKQEKALPRKINISAE